MVKTRFAPSPTGHLHIGGLRTAIFNYLYAKANGGEFILRIEDTDRERSKDEYTKAILEGLKWCKIDWDDICYQSKRYDIYKKYLDKLFSEGKAYKCYCSKERLDLLKKEQMERGENPHYDGHCRNIEEDIDDKPYVVRIKLPSEDITFNDYVHSQMHFSYKEFDDFIVQRSDGSFMYNFTNVVDDIECGVTDVIRGDDHLTNTAKQIVLYRLFGENAPNYAHVPMILGEDKARLSKRHGAKNVLEYKDMGILPDALVNYMVRLGWSYGDKEIFTKDELISFFNLENLNKSAAVFNQDKLLWVNAEHIKNSSPDDLLKYLKEFLDESCNKYSDEYLKKAAATLKARADTIVDMAEGMLFYCKEPQNYEEKGAKKYLKESIKEAMLYLFEELKNADFSNEEALKSAFEKTIEKFEIKMVKIAQPVRIGLTGRSAAPGIYEMLTILGKDESLKRIEKVINAIPYKAS
jgi:glutamyl-tRNA synthetase